MEVGILGATGPAGSGLALALWGLLLAFGDDLGTDAITGQYCDFMSHDE